ncbi:hypothetical protein [Bifidobacterium myosotis]|uniref:SGNH/GDSL hydrolase family protein n=1 Tax=Bifidobacterium myosotis TaxID=1630166 RepID=A0A5M9ZK34_9BIFI|nr:hypothetical protein [Bifidobacterium myosotis]KAA8827252.1 hypothetical protein EMO91_09420 [Bifidobacterium myosotis]
MAYDATTWSDGDIITADKLNHLEQGVAVTPLDGKTLVFLGDSWCAGSGDGAGAWATLIQQRYPKSTCVNKGHYGSDWAQAATRHAPHSGDPTDPLPDTIDYLIVEAYTNGLYTPPVEQDGKSGVIDQFNRLKRFGTPNATYWTDDASWQKAYTGDTGTFAAETDWVLGSLARAHPEARKLVIAPYRAPSQYPTSVGEQATGEAFATFLPSVWTLAEKYGYATYNGFDHSPIPGWDFTLATPYMWVNNTKTDATHLNAKGNEKITPAILDAILAL